MRSRAEWRAWLQANHQTSASVWLVTFKQGSEHYFSYAERVEEALVTARKPETRARRIGRS
jgi:alpha/beta superfamily hydrolase